MIAASREMSDEPKKEPPMNKALSKFIRSKIGMEEE